jgi:hypothetical protein
VQIHGRIVARERLDVACGCQAAEEVRAAVDVLAVPVLAHDDPAARADGKAVGLVEDARAVRLVQ